MLLLLAVLQAAPLEIARLERVTASPAARDNAAAVSVPDGVVVLWDQAAGIDRHAQPTPPVRIWRTLVTPAGAGEPTPLRLGAGNQWWPAPLTGQSPLLAAYVATPSRPTGDRDILLFQPDSTWGAATTRATVTRDSPGTPFPVNDATPALARLPDGRVAVAWSAGEYRTGRPYRDKNIRIAVLRDGVPTGQAAVVTDSSELGHEYAPALIAGRGDGLRVVYASDSAGGRYDLYLRDLGSAMAPGPPRRLTRSAGGATRPSLARYRGVAWLCWHDLSTNDVLIARIRGGTLEATQSLRTMLQLTDFAKAGQPLAPLAGASLFADGDRLGIVFVSTMALEPESSHIQTDVWIAWLRQGGETERRRGGPTGRSPSGPSRGPRR
jgi:hypothetical protein